VLVGDKTVKQMLTEMKPKLNGILAAKTSK
jgi:hypothetical protein